MLEDDPIIDSSLLVASKNNSFYGDEFIVSEISADLETRFLK